MTINIPYCYTESVQMPESLYLLHCRMGPPEWVVILRSLGSGFFNGCPICPRRHVGRLRVNSMVSCILVNCRSMICRKMANSPGLLCFLSWPCWNFHLNHCHSKYGHPRQWLRGLSISIWTQMSRSFHSSIHFWHHVYYAVGRKYVTVFRMHTAKIQDIKHPLAH